MSLGLITRISFRSGPRTRFISKLVRMSAGFRGRGGGQGGAEKGKANALSLELGSRNGPISPMLPICPLKSRVTEHSYSKSHRYSPSEVFTLQQSSCTSLTL